MDGYTPRFRVRSKRAWRPLIGIVVAYAMAAQSLLIALGGFSPPAQASDGAPVFELCLHDGQGASELPTGNPDHAGCTHCTFCFVGSHSAVVGTPPVLVRDAYGEIVEALWRPTSMPCPTIPRIR